MVFKVGQRITYSGRIGLNGRYYSQIKGVIIDYDPDLDQTLVEFDRNINGHEGLGNSPKGSCWWFEGNELLKKVQSSNVCANIRNLI